MKKFIVIAIIILYVSEKYKLKSFVIISKIVIALSVIVFIFEYAKYLGYDILQIIIDKLF